MLARAFAVLLAFTCAARAGTTAAAPKINPAAMTAFFQHPHIAAALPQFAQISSLTPLGGASQIIPARLILESAAVELQGLSPEKISAMPPEELNALAGRVMDGAVAVHEAEVSLPSVIADESATRKLLRGVLGERHARGLNPKTFADDVNKTQLSPSNAPQALSLAEYRRAVESSLAEAALGWPEETRRLAGREGAKDLGEKLIAAADRLQNLPALADIEKKPALAVGRDDAILEAVSDFEDLLLEADRSGLSKAARRDLTRMLRQAVKLRESLARLKALDRLAVAHRKHQAVGELPADLEQVATLLGHLTLRGRHDLLAKNPALASIHDSERRGQDSGRQLVVAESLLNSPEFNRTLQWLKPGARVVVLGGGDAAVQAVLSVLSANPDAKVTLIVEKIEPFHGLTKARAEGRVRLVALGFKPSFHLPVNMPKNDPHALRMNRFYDRPRYGTELSGPDGLIERFDGPLIVSAGLF